jgi:hypothetical protein
MFMIGTWPATHNGSFEVVKTERARDIPKILAKRHNKKVTTNRIGKNRGIIIDGQQHRVFDIDNEDDLTVIRDMMALLRTPPHMLN